MAYDPLSTSTRKARTGVLALAVAVLCFDAFATNIDDINMPNVGITFDESLIPFVLSIGTLFYLISFIVGVWDDVQNLVVPERVARRRESMKTVTDRLKSSSISSVLNTVQSYNENLVADTEPKVSQVGDLANELKGILDVPSRTDDRIIRQYISSCLDIFNVQRDELRGSIIDEIIDARTKIAECDRTLVRSVIRPYFRFRSIRLYVLEIGLPVSLALYAIGVQFFGLPTDLLRRLAS